MSRTPWDSTISEITPRPGYYEPLSQSADRLLIIDDSNQIRSSFIANIVKACNMHGRPYRIIQSDAKSLSETATMASPTGNLPEFSKPLVIYTANCPRNALPVLNLPEVQHLIIVSDIMMPSDTEVGLLGLLQVLTERHLPVSLIFASSERQNRYYVEDVLQSGKAIFTEKGGTFWGELAFSLVEHTETFQFQVIVRSDFDRAYSHAAGRNSGVVVPISGTVSSASLTEKSSFANSTKPKPRQAEAKLSLWG